MKTAYVRREGPDKLQQVRRESRAGHLIRRILSHTNTHTPSLHILPPAKTKLHSVSQHFVTHFFFSAILISSVLLSLHAFFTLLSLSLSVMSVYRCRIALSSD